VVTAWVISDVAPRSVLPFPPRDRAAGMVRACTAFPAIKASVRASASVLIAARPRAVWDVVWSPETTVTTNRATLAAGHLPGSPYQQAGEMQWFVHRQPDGRLTADVREPEHQRATASDSQGTSPRSAPEDPRSAGSRRRSKQVARSRNCLVCVGWCARNFRAVWISIAGCDRRECWSLA